MPVGVFTRTLVGEMTDKHQAVIIEVRVESAPPRWLGREGGRAGMGLLTS